MGKLDQACDAVNVLNDACVAMNRRLDGIVKHRSDARSYAVGSEARFTPEILERCKAAVSKAEEAAKGVGGGQGAARRKELEDAKAWLKTVEANISRYGYKK